MIDDKNIKRFVEIEIGTMFYDLTTQRLFAKDTEHTAGSSDGAVLEFAPGHPVSLALRPFDPSTLETRDE